MTEVGSAQAGEFVRLEVAQRNLGKEQPDFIELRLDDMFAAQKVADDIPARLGADYMAQDWADSDHVSLSLQHSDSSGPSLLIEKDFQCLNCEGRNPSEDADSFPNPLAHEPESEAIG